jgi:hypothetical protein
MTEREPYPDNLIKQAAKPRTNKHAEDYRMEPVPSGRSPGPGLRSVFVERPTRFAGRWRRQHHDRLPGQGPNKTSGNSTPYTDEAFRWQARVGRDAQVATAPGLGPITMTVIGLEFLVVNRIEVREDPTKSAWATGG